MDVAQGSAERTDDAVLLLKQLHQVERGRRPRGGAARDEPATALETQERAIEGLRADVLEHDVNAFLGRELAHHTLKAFGAVVDYVVGTERTRLLGLGVIADGG